MGAVHIDIHKQDRKYFETSFSSEEDIYKLLWMIDIVYEEAYQGNHEALCIINDLKNLIDIDNDALIEYIKIQNGKKPLSVKDFGKEIPEVVAERLGITKEDCERQIHKGVLDIINKNYELWSNWIKNKYKNTCIEYSKNKIKIKHHIEDEILKQMDYERKYCIKKNIFEGEEYPEDLQELINIQKQNYNKLTKLKEKLQKDKKKIELKEEIRKRISYNIQLTKDVGILKRHYNILVDKTNWKGVTTHVSFEEFQLHNMDDFEKEKQNIVKHQREKFEDEWQVEKIKETAKKVLTIKQYAIFNLYFINGLTQEKIAQIVNDTQGNISRDINNIIKKLKKYL